MRFGARPMTGSTIPRVQSALSNGLNTKPRPMNERERRDAMRLQRQLNLPRQGWLHQHS